MLPLTPHHDHSPAGIRERLARGPSQSYLRDFLYGAIDGTVTTFAIVAGVAGAGLSPRVVLVLGVANLLGDGFSMAVSNFLGTRAEEQVVARTRAFEHEHVRLFPEGEREEVRQIFAAKGFAGADLEAIVRRVTSDVRRWIDTMLVEEHGLALTRPDPLRAAWTTFLAFVAVGAIPLAPYLLRGGSEAGASDRFPWSAVLTTLVFFGIGALQGRVVRRRWWVCGLETLAMGGGAALIAYAVGRLLGHLT